MSILNLILAVENGSIDITTILLGVITALAGIVTTVFIWATRARINRETLEHKARLARIQTDKRNDDEKTELHKQVRDSLQQIRDTCTSMQHRSDLRDIVVDNSIARINERLNKLEENI